MNRRTLLRTSAMVGIAALATACSSGTSSTTTTTVAVTLAAAQAEAQAIYSALAGFYSQMASTLPVAAQQTATTALAALKATVAQFSAAALGGSWQTYATEAIQGIAAILSVLPLSSGVMLAINAGAGLIEALVAGLSSFTATVPAASAAVSLPFKVGASANAVYAPIPIPTR